MIHDIRDKLRRAIDAGVNKQDDALRRANEVLQAWMEIAPKEAPTIKVGKDGNKDGIEFWFVNADKLRQSKLTQMPSLQELLERDKRDGEGSWVQKIPITYEDAFLGVHSGSIVAVTHCWETEVRARSVGNRTSSPSPKPLGLSHVSALTSAHPLSCLVYSPSRRKTRTQRALR